ncbi:unnamed protein product [Rotaria socialis]
MDSNMSNQADILISNDVDSKLETTIKEKPYVQKPNQTVESENSLEENTERLNRLNFYLKNITTYMNYMQVFISIVTKFPLIQLNTTDKSPRIKYLCVADTSISPNEQLVSIQLSFENKVNFKHKFLNNLFPDLKLSDYLLIANGDLFNEEIKSLSQERYIESSVRSSKKQKSSFKDYYRKKQQEAASNALKQPSLANAVAVIKDTFPFEYLTFGNQMRGNIEYELQQIEKQKQIEYKPVYDSTSFKIPEEHRNKIKEWLEYDFCMRTEGNITRSRCLFLIGPTQHGKTSWARSSGPHRSFSINFSLREWHKDVKYTILDDTSWKDISPIAKGLLIAPGKIILTDKYMTKIELDNNKPCIACVNDKEGDIILNSDTDNYW